MLGHKILIKACNKVGTLSLSVMIIMLLNFVFKEIKNLNEEITILHMRKQRRRSASR